MKSKDGKVKGKHAITKDPADDEKVRGLPMGAAMAAEIASELEDEMGKLSIDLAVKALPATPTPREVKALLAAAHAVPRDYLIIRLAYQTGVRVAELAKLCFADVFDDGRIFVRQGKGKYDRYVCVDAETMALVDKWRGSRAVDERIAGVTPRQIDRIVRDYGMEVGLVEKYEAMTRSFSPHSLRHAFASHRYDNGMDLAALQKLLGHHFLTTTMIYVQTSMRHVSKEYRRTDPLLGRKAEAGAGRRLTEDGSTLDSKRRRPKR